MKRYNGSGNTSKEKDRPQFVDMTGKKFGRLTVLRIDRSYIYKGKAKVRWWCKCDCGNESRHGGYELRSGITKSCGCLSHENCRKNFLKRLNPLDGAVGRLLTAYKYSAKKRNVNFDLSFDDFKMLTSQKCFYCGVLPEQIMSSGRNNYL